MYMNYNECIIYYKTYFKIKMNNLPILKLFTYYEKRKIYNTVLEINNQ